jgi:pyruvate/2-oxoglutarate dehydrogenase complex dihydrolipoamide acyltransferase (E2) component
MKIASLAVALAVAAFPVVTHAQTGVKADEQIILKQVMTDKRAVYAQNLQLTDAESRAFWPIYDEYEGKAKKLNDEFLALVDDYAAKFGSMTDADATAMLKKKMQIEKDREALKQTYTKKVAKALPPVKALRYAQIETRLDNMIRRDVYGLIPLAQ